MATVAIANPAKEAPAGPAFRLYQPDDPRIALGLAVGHLTTKPAFARLRFGDWSRILIGQINRKHYRFVLDETNRVVGFLGWALSTREAAEAWLDGRAATSLQDASNGECIVFNAWAADTPEVNRVVLTAARQAMLGKETAYFKRAYANGTVRPVRINVNEFVAAHM